MVGRHAFHTFDIVYKIYNPYLLVMVGEGQRLAVISTLL